MMKETRREMKEAYIKGMKAKLEKGEFPGHGFGRGMHGMGHGACGGPSETLIGFLWMMFFNFCALVVMLFLQGFGVMHLAGNVFMTYIIVSGVVTAVTIKALGFFNLLAMKKRMHMMHGMHRGGMGMMGMGGCGDTMQGFFGMPEHGCCEDEDGVKAHPSKHAKHDVKDLS